MARQAHLRQMRAPTGLRRDPLPRNAVKPRERDMRAMLHGMLLNAAIICAAPAAPPETPWGEPDLQGIWTTEYDTPLQRPAKYGTREFFTPEERQRIDQETARILGAEK